MKSFVIFAIVVTIIYVIYYTVIIVQDLYGKPKDEKSQGESFDVSDMTDEEESIAVSESDGGFSVGDNWKSHSTLTLLATQDLPTFLYYMIDPLKSWCWGAILFYPFKNSRFS